MFRRRLLTSFAAAAAALGMFAATASAGNNGYSGYASTHSCGASSGGIANATYDSAAGYRSHSAVIYYYGAYYCY